MEVNKKLIKQEIHQITDIIPETMQGKIIKNQVLSINSLIENDFNFLTASKNINEINRFKNQIKEVLFWLDLSNDLELLQQDKTNLLYKQLVEILSYLTSKSNDK